VIATAAELFEGRHYPGVIAMCSDALDDEPECLPLLMIRARARIALRLDLDAQADLREIVRLDPHRALAYRLLGELAARRNENAAAAELFRETLRLDPDDREALDWLLIVDALVPPAPSPATSSPPPPAARASSVRREASSSTRFARGTQPPAEAETNERPTKPFASVGRLGDARRALTPASASRAVAPGPPPLPRSTVTGHPPTQPPAKQAPRLVAASAPAQTTRMATRAPVVELPGFGEYLVESGILTRERLRIAEAYQRSMKVQLSTAIVTLGLATPQRIAWAAIAHQAEQV
jgi:tetratricopeptide (TPR) repeat protein